MDQIKKIIFFLTPNLNLIILPSLFPWTSLLPRSIIPSHFRLGFWCCILKIIINWYITIGRRKLLCSGFIFPRCIFFLDTIHNGYFKKGIPRFKNMFRNIYFILYFLMYSEIYILEGIYGMCLLAYNFF